MDLSDFSEGTKASASYERQRRRITGDNDGDDDGGEPAGITTRTGARVYATRITAKRSGCSGRWELCSLFQQLAGPPISCPVRARNRLLARRSVAGASVPRPFRLCHFLPRGAVSLRLSSRRLSSRGLTKVRFIVTGEIKDPSASSLLY